MEGAFRDLYKDHDTLTAMLREPRNKIFWNYFQKVLYLGSLKVAVSVS